MNGCSPL
jgi:molybdenum cofactor sulfurtransferase